MFIRVNWLSSLHSGLALLLVVGLVSISTASISTASSPAVSLAAPKVADREDLGEDLLGGGLLESLQTPVPSANLPDESQALPDLDEMRRLLDPDSNQPAGEDLGQQRQAPLKAISDEMQRAGKLIASQNLSGKTRQAQQAILTDLDKLIVKLDKQCQKCSGKSGGKNSKDQKSQSSTPKPGAGKPAAGQGMQSQPAPSKISQGGGGEAKPGDPVQGDSVKQLWGQLPEHLRQQLLQSSTDEFLPKYRQELEAYFRRLAEQPPNQSPAP